MPDKITFLGDGGKVTIEVFDYERSESSNDDDANWLSSRISVETPPFSGQFSAALTTHETATLHDRLEAALRSLSGTVSFHNTEEDLLLEFKFMERGSVFISGVATPHRSPAVALHFQLNSDQSIINLAAQELSNVLRHFPVRQVT